MSRGKVSIWCSVGVGAAILCYSFPPFRVKPINGAGRARPSPANVAAPVNVTDYADELWKNRLPDAFDSAVDIEELLTSVDRDSEDARRRFGRQVGLGGACFLFVRGSGQVEEVTANYCTLKIGGRARRARIRIGVVVGNVVRDSTGLIDVSQFANSQDFNNLSAQLNQRVETDVIAPSRERLRVGARVRFVGCARVSDDSDFDPLGLVPVYLDIVDPEVRP